MSSQKWYPNGKLALEVDGGIHTKFPTYPKEKRKKKIEKKGCISSLSHGDFLHSTGENQMLG